MATRAEKAAHLKEIAVGGEISPQQLVEDAADENSPFHEDFEWDDEKAGHEFRLHQARKTIRSFRSEVVTNTRRIAVPLYVRDPDKPPKDQGYVSLAVVKTDTQKKQEVMKEELGRLAAALVRVQGIAEYLSMDGRVKDIVRAVDMAREDFEKRFGLG